MSVGDVLCADGSDLIRNECIGFKAGRSHAVKDGVGFLCKVAVANANLLPRINA
ncbi:MAG: hypothetical protein ABSC37_03105 [Xanthobacteraceae bacterium]